MDQNPHTSTLDNAEIIFTSSLALSLPIEFMVHSEAVAPRAGLETEIERLRNDEPVADQFKEPEASLENCPEVREGIGRFINYMLDKPDFSVAHPYNAGGVIRNNLDMAATSGQLWTKVYGVIKEYGLVEVEKERPVSTRYKRVTLNAQRLLWLTEIDKPLALLTDQILEKATAKLAAADEAAAAQAPTVNDRPEPEPKADSAPTQVFKRVSSPPPSAVRRTISAGRSASRPPAKPAAKLTLPKPPDDRPTFRPRQLNGVAQNRERKTRQAETRNILAAMAVHRQGGIAYLDYEHLLSDLKSATKVDTLDDAEEIKSALARNNLIKQDLDDLGYPRLQLTGEGERFIRQQLKIRQAAAKKR